MGSQIPTVKNIAPYSNRTPSPEQVELANSATDSITQSSYLPPEVDALIRDALAVVAIDNRSVVEAVRDFSGNSEQKDALVRAAYNFGREVPFTAHLLVWELWVAIETFSLTNALQIKSDNIYTSAIYALHGGDGDCSEEVDSAKIKATVIAAIVLQDLHYGRDEMDQYGKAIREAAAGVKSRLADVEPIIPELFARKTLSPDVIDTILWERALTLEDGEL